MSGELPAVLAAPPWGPLRKPKKIPPTPPRREERVVWSSEAERAGYASTTPTVSKDDPIVALPPAERDAALLRLFEHGGIIKIYAGQLLSREALLEAMRTARGGFAAAYDLPTIALARYGLEVLDAVLALADRSPNDAKEALMRVDSPRMWAFFSSHGATAAYIARYPETVAACLLPVAFGEAVPAADAKHAQKALVAMRAAGKGADVLRVARELGDDAAGEVEALFAPPPLPPKPPSLPPFVQPASLPALRLRGATSPIEPEAFERALQLLACLPLGAARDAIATVKAACDPTSLGDLSRALLEAWTAAGGPAAHKWVLLAAGEIGDDLVAGRLAEHAIAWSEAGKHPRAALAIEALGMMAKDSDRALAWLTRMSTAKSSPKPVKKHATAQLAAFAESSGLTQDEIGDRTAPDLGFDARGRLLLDYGPRAFEVVFDEAFKPTLVGADKKPIRSLPKPAASDDPQKAERAKATWDAVKKEGSKIVEEQVRRLERAMCSQRRWTRERFETLLLRHPLMQMLTRRLLWGAWSADGSLATTFRVAEDGTFAGAGDDAIEVPGDVSVGIVHPLAIDASARSAWGDRFGDYAIVQPFRQLARETYALTDEERGGTALTRWDGQSVGGSRFFTLKARGWEFLDYDIGKRLPGGPWVTLSTEPGLEFLAGRPEDQTLGTVELHDAKSFGALDAITASELVRDVELLRG